MPHIEHDPTPEQLAALRQVIASGRPPYVDFSLFGPKNRRLVHKLQYTAVYTDRAGNRRRKEMPGPPDYAAWLRCWHVYRTALLILGGFDQQPLNDYAEWIRAFSEKYSLKIGRDAWAIVYEADVRMRSEHFERVRHTFEGSPSVTTASIPGTWCTPCPSTPTSPKPSASGRTKSSKQ